MSYFFCLFISFPSFCKNNKTLLKNKKKERELWIACILRVVCYLHRKSHQSNKIKNFQFKVFLFQFFSSIICERSKKLNGLSCTNCTGIGFCNVLFSAEASMKMDCVYQTVTQNNKKHVNTYNVAATHILRLCKW